MKKIFTLLVTFGLCLNSFAQSKKDAVRSLKDIEDSKSGNFLDAFAGFYQFAFKSVSVNEKSLELNSTLFSLVKNYDEDILQTRNRKSIVFLRNFQINTKLNLNDNLNFNGYSAGFTYAVLNKRDKEFINLVGLPVEKDIDAFNKLIEAVVNIRVKSENAILQTSNGRLPTPEESDELSDKLSEVATAITNDETVQKDLQVMKSNFEKELDNQINRSTYFQAKNLKTTAEVRGHIKKLKSEYMKSLEIKPFLSLTTEGISDKDGKLNQASIGTVFLVGNHFGELDVRAKYNYADTISPSMKRSVFNGKLGYNFKFKNKKNSKSFFEVKLYGEYNKIFDNVLSDEKEETVLANSDLRIRLSDDLWIPLTIKYDVENENFLGFLNVTYNFDGGKDKD